MKVPVAADRQSGHEDRVDRARRVDRDPEDQPQQPQPEHLVDEGTGTLQEEQRGEKDEKCGKGGPLIAHESDSNGLGAGEPPAPESRVQLLGRATVPDANRPSPITVSAGCQPRAAPITSWPNCFPFRGLCQSSRTSRNL
jgi:hypothetical protein